MKKLIQNQAVRYIFFGGCTTGVNLVLTYVMRNLAGLNVTAANTVAVLLSILFAYVVNKLFVFEHKAASPGALFKEAASFIGMRLGTMVVEVFGVVLLSSVWGLQDMIAKLIIQVVILVLNYLISRFVVFKDEDSEAVSVERLAEKKRGRRFFAAGFVLSALVAAAGFIAFGMWPFGDNTVLIIDSLHQYLPFYTDFQGKLQDSQSLLYSFSGGLGYNFWSTYAYYMASPLNFLMAFIPRENVCDFMDFVILFKIGLCGGCFSWYLHRRDPQRKYLPVVFGMMFALSNFVIGYYFNLMWLDSIAMLPLIMMGIERIVRGESGRMFGLSLFYGLWCNYYIGFMLCIFSCLYYLVRWISCRRITARQVLHSSLTFAWYALLAGGMAALVLLPAYAGLSASESMQSNTFPSTVKFYESLWGLLENHMAFMTPVNISNSQVGLNVYCGMLTVLLTVLYVFDGKIRLRKRMAHFGLCALLLLSFSFNMLNYVWHGFHVQNGLPNRFAFLYIAVLLVMAYDAIGHIRSFLIPELVFAWIATAGFVAVDYMQRSGEIKDYVYYISFGLLTLYFVLLLFGRLAKRVRFSIFCGIVSGVALIEVSANAVYGIICNDGVTRSIYIADQKSYQTMMAQQDDDEFFRSEIDRQRMRNVTMYAGGNAMVMFNSTMLESVVNFCDSLGIEARTNKNGYLGVTKLINDVLGIRYLASPSKVARTMYQFERVAEDGELALYKNDNALSLGFMVKDDIASWDIEAGEPLQVQNSFVELATGLEPIYVLDRYIDMEDGENYGIKIPEDKQVYLCIDTRVDNINLNTPEYTKSFDDFTDHLYVINASDESDMADFTVTLKDGQSTVQAQVYTCANEAYEQVRDKLAESQLTSVKVDGNRVSGNVDAKEDGTLLLTIPYDTGWRITVDGKETESYAVGQALTGVHLPAGIHEIRMKYTPKGLWAGTFITLLCAALYMVSGVLEKRVKTWLAGRSKEGETGHMGNFSDKAMRIETGIFAVLNAKKNELEKQGKKIWNLSVGTPDFRPPQHIIDAVSEAAKKPENYKYALVELPELLEAAQGFFKRRFDLDLAQDEIMALYGSQEGMTHIAWTLCNPGDLVLVPNPGYPIFSIGPQLCDAEIWEYPLYEENGYLPDLKAIPEDVARDAKLMVFSYPGNPVCKLAPDSFYDELIAFAKKYDIVLLHDNAYADLVFGGKRGSSFLNHEGAKDVGIEFYSLSKTFNYTGARVSFAIGNAEIIQKFKAMRTQFDYGTFLPVQYGAIAALTGPFDCVIEQCAKYEERNKALCGGLREIGWNVPDSEGTMFVWAPLPEGYTNSEQFCLELMEKSGVICVPGTSFGSLGEGYVRLALVLPPEKLEEAVESIRESGILRMQ